MEEKGMLEIRHYSKSYKEGKKAADDVSLTVMSGDIYGFIGHNGAGKSTTIRAVVGVLDFTEGEIYIDGHSVKSEPMACKRVTAYIPDNPDLYENLTGIQYLNFVADVFDLGSAEREERIRKYADLFDIPSEAHRQAIIQVARGHRKTDLLDEKEYPIEFFVPNGNAICLPYLSALIRLADEIDVAASRNPILLYDIKSLTDETQIIENKKVRAVRRLEIREDSFILYVDPSDRVILRLLYEMAAKMQKTLDTCRAAVLGRTPYVITQQRIELVELSPSFTLPQ